MPAYYTHHKMSTENTDQKLSTNDCLDFVFHMPHSYSTFNSFHYFSRLYMIVRWGLQQWMMEKGPMITNLSMVSIGSFTLAVALSIYQRPRSIMVSKSQIAVIGFRLERAPALAGAQLNECLAYASLC